MTNALKIFGIIIVTLILFTIVHNVSHKLSQKSFVKGNITHKMNGVKDRNRDIVRHGFLQHHIHDGSGNVLWQKPSDPKLVVQEEMDESDILEAELQAEENK